MSSCVMKKHRTFYWYTPTREIGVGNRNTWKSIWSRLTILSAQKRSDTTITLIPNLHAELQMLASSTQLPKHTSTNHAALDRARNSCNTRAFTAHS
ncbi:hypothetical protein KC19_VG156900 [Ceratodon purpureus]|uniref:Uncharacterized protein n=1 Tax=Ceratodon purpureus TaxID=3225 RepID=A0A8T0HQS3_CERPU|nr:hypothetical protein KC19_VG156900 [Ceratodon purpureus]